MKITSDPLGRVSNSIENEHTTMVNALVKTGEEIQASLTPEKCNLLHAILGIVTEVGELADTVKKHVIYCQPLDKENAVEEMGDIEFYLRQFRQELQVLREDILQHNINKLSKRYPGWQYTDEKAKERLDKAKES